MVPAEVTVIGIVWAQAGAWRVGKVETGGSPGVNSIFLAAALLTLLIVFHVVLKPGIRFY